MAQNISRYFAMLANGKRRFRMGESRQERSDSMHLYREAARSTTDLQTQLPVARKSPRICIKTTGHGSHLPRSGNGQNQVHTRSVITAMYLILVDFKLPRYLYLESKFYYFQSRFLHVYTLERKDFRIN